MIAAWEGRAIAHELTPTPNPSPQGGGGLGYRNFALALQGLSPGRSVAKFPSPLRGGVRGGGKFMGDCSERKGSHAP